MKKWLLIFSIVVTLTACGTVDEADENRDVEGVFEIAVIPSQSTGEMQTGLNNLEEFLTEQLGRQVVVEQYPNYNAVVEALNYNHIDLAFLGPLTYLIAHEQSGAQAILTIEVDGSSFYHSYIITNNNENWEDLDDLLADVNEVDFAFASISSTSGHLIPGLHLRQLGYYDSENEHSFNQIQFAGSHDIVASLVQSGEVDAGAVDSAILESLINEDEEEGGTLGEDLKIIWQSEPLYQYPWVVPAETNDEIITEIQKAFYEIDDPEILRVFGGASRFVEADDSQYADVLEAAREFDMLD
ncbi:phosphate/phosphite/phosphonate ABC transporter substrate-binding protein [Bacillus sp. JCM 19034]|uniref:phosphate/phosphite/phosphonate ABC transporter substrate-binding protein n=1 Tax=Bacillus sp. JCM 19034 TaxID=1481928 RepID=UPI000783D1FF|nr:phosphate/phosphite/phosphonate ABC transporter substrate-binding protein [Bacillus sp. JCM 19034]